MKISKSFGNIAFKISYENWHQYYKLDVFIKLWKYTIDIWAIPVKKSRLRGLKRYFSMSIYPEIPIFNIYKWLSILTFFLSMCYIAIAGGYSLNLYILFLLNLVNIAILTGFYIYFELNKSNNETKN